MQHISCQQLCHVSACNKDSCCNCHSGHCQSCKSKILSEHHVCAHAQAHITACVTLASNINRNGCSCHDPNPNRPLKDRVGHHNSPAKQDQVQVTQPGCLASSPCRPTHCYGTQTLTHNYKFPSYRRDKIAHHWYDHSNGCRLKLP